MYVCVVRVQMETCSGSLLKLSSLVLKSVHLEPVFRRMLRAHASLLQAAAVLQMVHARDSLLERLCEHAGARLACFTDTKVQILTTACSSGSASTQACVLVLLAVLVQKYKY
jgi:uncharacterized protein YigA (DUF484 family)